MSDAVTLEQETVDWLVAAALFAHDAIRMVIMIDGDGPVLDLAERYGLSVRRRPYSDEVSDPKWWGNHAGAVGVPDVSPPFQEFITKMELDLSKEE